MALKKDQQQSLSFLALMATRLLEADPDGSLEKVLSTIDTDIKGFEKDTNTLLQPVVVDGKVEFKVVSLNKDFLRTRKPNDESLTLRSKKHGVSVDVKLVKDGDFAHDNGYVVTALRALADDIEGLGFELKELENEDLKSERIAELRGDAVTEGDDVADDIEHEEHEAEDAEYLEEELPEEEEEDESENLLDEIED
ncbi:hypothetical protein [Vibrio harveyi]|uniref:hypothetical protein n=1 Tax=Vibrio harveyi TaxID=669 RepID=UPI003CEFFB48